jgi:hypothetical protein
MAQVNVWLSDEEYGRLVADAIGRDMKTSELARERMGFPAKKKPGRPAGAPNGCVCGTAARYCPVHDK